MWWSSPLTEVEQYRELLTTAELERLRAYRRISDRQRFLTGRVVAKSVVANWLGLRPERIEFDASCPDCDRHHGPPRLPGSPLSLSIAHSGDRVGVAVAANTAVGLDVEETGRRLDEGMFSYALGESELAALHGLTEDERHAAFFRYWAGKEALMKATGDGLRIGLRSITLSAPGQASRLVTAEHPSLRGTRAALAELSAGPGYAAALAALGTSTVTVRQHWWDRESPHTGVS